MRREGSSFTYIDKAAIDAAELNETPYEWAYVHHAIPEHFLEKVLADAPPIGDQASLGLPRLSCGPHFKGVIDELLSDDFRRILEKKLHTDLSQTPRLVLVTENPAEACNDIGSDPDAPSKLITVIVGLSHETSGKGFCPRILNGPDRNEYAFEFTPEFGGMFMFKGSDKSWHGFLPQEGPHTSLLLCYCDSESYVAHEYRRYRFRTYWTSLIRKLRQLLPHRQS